MIGRVYKIVHSRSKICYIGSTFNTLVKRWQVHKAPSNKCCIAKYFKLYGIDQFKIILIKEYEVCDRSHLEAYEQLWISKLSTIEQVNTFQIKRVSKKQYREANKERLNEKASKWYEANKDKIKDQKKQYREDNKDIIRERNKNYHLANKSKINEQKKNYYEAKKDIIREQKKNYRASHKERLNEKASKWYEANKDKIKQKYMCECGSEIRCDGKLRHERSIKHQDWITTQA